MARNDRNDDTIIPWWRMETAESRSRAVGTELEQEVARLEVGFWTPAGPFLRDDLFPHVKGNFRRRVIPVASVHVSKT